MLTRNNGGREGDWRKPLSVVQACKGTAADREMAQSPNGTLLPYRTKALNH